MAPSKNVSLDVKRKPVKPHVSNIAEASTRELLDAALASISKCVDAGNADPKRLFFPDGIGLIAVEVSVGTANAKIRVAADPKI